jgi:sphingolipid delta-4 desaturase
VNLLSFNAGLHVEHHDIMRIPWNRLPKLRQIAPEFYNDLETIRSYTLIGLKFVFANRKTFEEDFNNEAHRNVERFGDAAMLSK